MKISFLLKTALLFIEFLGFASVASAYDFMVDSICYNVINEDEVAVTHPFIYDKYTYSGYIAIPSTVTYANKSFTVAAIGDEAFYDSEVTGIDIPGSVRSIGCYAFTGCENLRSVVIGEGCDTIYDDAFSGCVSLSDLVIPNSVVYVGGRDGFTENDGDYTFHDTPWYNNLPDGVVYVGRCAYTYKGNRSNVTTISLNPGTTCIVGGAFSECINLTSIDIPNSVISIGNVAFYMCRSLENVSIGNKCATIGDLAFALHQSRVSITSVTCKAKVPPVKNKYNAYDGYGWFVSWRYTESFEGDWVDFDNGVYDNAILYVPLGSVMAYMNANEWGKFKNIVGVIFPDDENTEPTDVNQDGEVNIADVNAVIDLILAGSSNGTGDANGDGEVNIADINTIIDAILSR